MRESKYYLIDSLTKDITNIINKNTGAIEVNDFEYKLKNGFVNYVETIPEIKNVIEHVMDTLVGLVKQGYTVITIVFGGSNSNNNDRLSKIVARYLKEKYTLNMQCEYEKINYIYPMGEVNQYTLFRVAVTFDVNAAIAPIPTQQQPQQ